jgi:hypothetical protein
MTYILLATHGRREGERRKRGEGREGERGRRIQGTSQSIL